MRGRDLETVRDIARRIVAREGGFANDPNDPGGATNHGVTLATLRRLRGAAMGIEDLRALGPEDAATIFVDAYFRAPRLYLLPRALWPTVFDMYVNSGANAVRILQRLLNEMGLRVDVDGIVGPATAAAARRALALAPDHLVDAYGIARRNYYYRLAARNPRLRKFVRRRDGGKGGWILRAEGFIAPRWRLSDAQHRARVAQWG